MEKLKNFITGRSAEHGKLVALLLALLGLVVLFAFDWITAGEAAALATPVLAAIVAFSLYETVSEKRKLEAKRLEQERMNEKTTAARQQRSEAYLEIIEHGVRSFGSDGLKHSEQVIRTKISLWGSQRLIEAYLDWRKAIQPYSGKGAVPILPEDRARLQEALASLVSAARIDVDVDSSPERLASVESLASVLFNDYVINTQAHEGKTVEQHKT